MNALQTLFDRLMALGDAGNVATDRLFKCAGILIDLSSDLGREDGTELALEWCDELAKRKLTNRQGPLLEYFRANAWHNRQGIRHRDKDARWRWEQPEIQQQVLYFRRATRSSGFSKLTPHRRCQILTNLGSRLNEIGRVVEAIATWTRALAIDPRFGAALGNRGVGLMQYARYLYDPEFRGIFLYYAHRDLTAALSAKTKYAPSERKGARAFFAAKKAEIEAALDVEKAEKQFKMEGLDLGKSREERSYRKWSLWQCLFLNPLNDLGAHSIAARDMLSLPDFTLPLGEAPTHIGFFNQMKQEFVSARWLLYEGLHPKRAHFSDRRVAIFNTLDYPTYGLPIEKVKAAYRIAYSLLDKIAFFLNDYAKLGIEPRQVYFKTLWYTNRDFKMGVRKELRDYRNLPMRGLYWLAKDIFDDTLHDVMEPEAQDLHVIRNALEHSYLKVHELRVPATGYADYDRQWKDRLALSVYRSDFEEKTLHVFRLARAGLIYLSLGMHREEQIRQQGKSKGRVAPMTLGIFEDKWKR